MERKGEKESDNSFGVAGLVFSILSVVFSITIIFSIFFGLLGFVFALVQRKRANNRWSLWSIILSIIGIVLSILIAVYFVSIVGEIQQLIETCQANPTAPGCAELLQAAGGA